MPFGYNWTSPNEPLTHPFLYWTSDQLGSNVVGQASASAEIAFASIPTDGHAQFVIPFFSDVWLPEERGPWDEVTDYRLYAYNVSLVPNYYCVRMSWNGMHIRQVCDPNDGFGRTTGKVPGAVLEFWNEMKRAHYIDAQTRSILVTMPLRNNNAGVRFRLSMLFHVTSTGGILPSYDIESRPDAIDSSEMQGLFFATLIMTIYFAAMEVPMRETGCGENGEGCACVLTHPLTTHSPLTTHRSPVRRTFAAAERAVPVRIFRLLWQHVESHGLDQLCPVRRALHGIPGHARCA